MKRYELAVPFVKEIHMLPMRCRLAVGTGVLAAMFWASVAGAGERPAVRPIPMPQPAVTDEQIGMAISRGVDFLLGQFDEKGQLKRAIELTPEGKQGLAVADVRAREESLRLGHQLLYVYALLQASDAIRDERLNLKGKTMPKLIAAMKAASVIGMYETYSRGIRATALALHCRPEDRQVLLEDVKYLLDNVHGGAYTYGRFEPAPGYPQQLSQMTNRDRTIPFGDHSNSQYGLLGVWSGAEVGVEVPMAYWQMVDGHWTATQLADGQWRYNISDPPPGTPVPAPQGLVGSFNMTVAGLASLFVTHDWLVAPRFGTDVGRPPMSMPVQRGLQWLEAGNNCISLGNGYGMYGLERVGLACGFKYFGKHDWYAEHAASVVPNLLNLNPNADNMTVAYWVLFLSRGRHPVLMSKLRFDGFWANRPRDMANLSRFASRELERPVNWQVVPIDRDWQDWTDSPILYLASHDRPKLKEGDYVKIKSFIDAGGLLFTQSDGGRANFSTFVMDLGRKLYPMYEWKDLLFDHELYSLNSRINPKPRLKCLSNGSRILMLHSTEDLAASWQLRAEKTKKNIFDLGLNLFIYAAGKTDLRNRLSTTYIPEPPAMDQKLAVARVKYAGNWDPEPYAIVRFGRWFGFQTGLGLQVSTVETEKLDAGQRPVAILTGNAPFTLREAEIAALQKYVEDGGVVIADACGSAPEFDASFALAMSKAFPQTKLALIPATHALLASEGNGMQKLAEPVLRPYTMQKLGRGAARLQMLRSGKGAVIYSPLDVTTGLLDNRGWTFSGYEAGYAQAVLKNAMLWGWGGSPE